MFRDYEITVDYDDLFRVLLIEQRFDLVIYLQSLPDLKDIPLLLAHNTMLVPMYDQVRNAPRSLWFEFRDFRFLSFSRVLHQKLSQWSFTSFLMQYFPAPEVPPPEEKTNSCVFWVRSDTPNLSTFKQVMSDQKIETLFVRRELPLDDTDRQGLGVSEIQEFYQTENRAHYVGMLAHSRFLFASRLYEGIGLSFLEAMARGVCVIAPDLPTMNEYIVHGYNGYLYDPQAPAPIPEIPYSRVHANLVEYTSRKHREFEESVPGLHEYVKNKPVRYPFHRVISKGFAGSALVALSRRIKWALS